MRIYNASLQIVSTTKATIPIVNKDCLDTEVTSYLSIFKIRFKM